jgi:hypothetical protein
MGSSFSKKHAAAVVLWSYFGVIEKLAGFAYKPQWRKQRM